MVAKADPGKFYIRAEDLERVGHDLLVKHDLPSEDATTVARCLVEADLRGVETHGVVRLPHYLNRVRLGLIKPRPEIKIDRAHRSRSPSTATTALASSSPNGR